MPEPSTTEPVEVRFTAWPAIAKPIFRSDTADAIEYLTPVLGSISTAPGHRRDRRNSMARDRLHP